MGSLQVAVYHGGKKNGKEILVSRFTSATNSLCALGQILSLFWVSVSSSVKQSGWEPNGIKFVESTELFGNIIDPLLLEKYTYGYAYRKWALISEGSQTPDLRLKTPR